MCHSERMTRALALAREHFPELAAHAVVNGVCLEGPEVLLVVGLGPRSVSLARGPEELRARGVAFSVALGL